MLLISLKCVVTEDVLFSIVIVLIQIFAYFWQWNNFENQLIFDEVKAYKNGAIFGPPGTCTYNEYFAKIASKRLAHCLGKFV